MRGCCFGSVVTWRVEIAHCFGEEVSHALRWQIKSPAALLRSAAGLPVSRATIRLIGPPTC